MDTVVIFILMAIGMTGAYLMGYKDATKSAMKKIDDIMGKYNGNV